MTKFHFYILCSLVCFIGLFNAPIQAAFWLLFAMISFFVFAMIWAFENK